MKRLLIILSIMAVATSCMDRNGVVGAIFRLRDDSPLPSWFTLPAGVKREQVAVTITDYQSTTPRWKVRFIVRDKGSGRVIQEVMGRGYWHPDSERNKAPASTYPNWVIIDVNGIKNTYEQSEHN